MREGETLDLFNEREIRYTYKRLEGSKWRMGARRRGFPENISRECEREGEREGEILKIAV